MLCFVKNMKPILLFSILVLAGAKGFKDYSYISEVNEIFENNAVNSKLIKIGKDLLDVRESVTQLNTSIREISDLRDCEKFYGIGRKLFELQEIILDQKVTRKHAIYNNSVNHLQKFYDFLGDQMREIRINMKKFENVCSENVVVQAIINHRFQEAEDLLNSLGGKWILKNIVNEVYENNRNNIKTLLDFTESLSSIRLSVSMVSAIRTELEANGDADLYRSDLIKVAEFDILNQPHIERIQDADVKSFRKSFVVSLMKIYTNIMESEMLNHTFASSKNIPVFLNELYKVSKTLPQQLIFDVIDRAYGRIRNKDILDNIFQCNISQREDALVYMYRKMKDSHELDTGIIRLARYIWEIPIKHFYKGLMEKRHEDLVSIWYELPYSIKNLCTGRGVCIRNAVMLEYVYAAQNSIDDNRRYVFTYKPNEKVNQDIWYVENDLGSDDFYFINKEHINEYIYASEDGMGKKTRLKYVFTWKPKGRVDSGKSAWNIETVGGYLHIRNVFNKKWLLCVTSNKNMDDSRHVFALEEQFSATDKSCVWVLEAC